MPVMSLFSQKIKMENVEDKEYEGENLDTHQEGLAGEPEAEPPAEISPAEPPNEPDDPGSVHEDSSSIIEMEVDDSNTGDTITSNPEIDLGYAAAAATAVIVDSEEGEKSNDDVVIVAESQSAASPCEEERIEAPVQPENSFADDEELNREDSNQPEEIYLDLPSDSDETAPQIISVVGAVGGEVERKESIAESDEIMEIDSEQNEPGEDVIAFEPEMDPDIMLQSSMDGDVEQDKAFLHEEESLASLPEDTAETDKENNGGDGDLVCDDENEDGDDDYLEITRRRISQDREGNCYWYDYMIFKICIIFLSTGLIFK